MSHSVTLTSGRQVGGDMIVLGIGVAFVGLGMAALLARGSNGIFRKETDRGCQGIRSFPVAPRLEDRDDVRPPTITAARRLNRAAGMLAFSVLTDSAMEHYRGSFHNRAMYTPLLVSLLSLLVSAHGVADQRRGAHGVRDLAYSTAALTGLAGTAFHFYNVLSRPGRVTWENLFYGAPLGAPTAILLSGLLGFMAERVRETRPTESPRFLGLPAGRLAAAITGAGLIGTAGEAGLLHFRGAYHSPFMYVPVTIPPAAAAVMTEMAFGRPTRRRTFSRWLLRLTAAIGFAGVGFHTYGVHRNIGGWRNWRQNILNGPPLPAPPSFTGLALAGLGALSLIEERPDA